MSDTQSAGSFTRDEKIILHSLAEMFQEKDDRDQLRQLLHEGTTLREIILAYKTQRRMVGTLKAVAGLIVLLGATAGAIKGFGLWPK